MKKILISLSLFIVMAAGCNIYKTSLLDDRSDDKDVSLQYQSDVVELVDQDASDIDANLSNVVSEDQISE